MITPTFSQFFEIDAIKEGPNGYVRRVARRRRNLTTDAGLNSLFTTNKNYCYMFDQFLLGTGTVPLKRDGGAITFTRSGDTLTASSAFFEANDAGRVFVAAGSSSELRVSSVSDGQTAIVSTAGPEFAALAGTVYYVNRTGLASAGPLGSFSEIATNDTGDRHGSTFDAATGKLTSWVSRLSGTATADTLYTEICWMDHNSNIFGVGLINGGVGDLLLTGERYRVKLITERTFSPVSPTAAAPLPISGIPGVNVSWALEAVETYRFGSDGNPTTNGDGSLDARLQSANVTLTDSTAPLRSPPVLGELPWVGATKATAAISKADYVPNSFCRDFSATWGSNTTAFSGVRSICFGGNTFYNRLIFRGLLDAPIGKALEEKLTLNFRFKMDRNLSA